MPNGLSVNRTYRNEAPVSISRSEVKHDRVWCEITCGRGQVIRGVGKSARNAYYSAMSNYRNLLSQELVVPAIIDETGEAL